MKPRQLGWKWPLVGLGVLLLLAIAVLPRIFGDSTYFAKLIETELSDWTGGKVALTGPVELHYFPDISVRSGLSLTGGTRLPMVKSLHAKNAKVSLDLVDLLRGRVTIDAIKLTRTRIMLDPASATPTAEPKAMIDKLLAGGSVHVLHINGGRIVFPTANGTEAIKHVDLFFDGSDGAGAVSSFGSFLWRNETVRYSLSSGALSKSADLSTMPVALSISSNPINAKVTGRASFGKVFQLEGDTQTGIDNLRSFLQWVGIGLPKGDSLKALSATGAFRLTGGTLTFDDGSFSLDGNKAVGRLAIAGGARPRVEGTLDFDQLTLDPYLADMETGSAAATSPPAELFDWALLKHFDADLRVSAGAINAAKLRLGGGGFTVTAKGGVLAGDVSELELCGGSASGHVGADIASPTKQLSLTANLDDVSMESCLQQLALAVPVRGVGVVKTEIAAEGRTADELVRNLSGSLKLKARDGAVPIDFSRLMTATAPLEGEGWNSSSATTFDSLNAECRLAAGHIWCQTFNMQTPRGLVSGAGDIDLPKQTVDWNLSVANQVYPVKTSQLGADAPKVSIRGSLSQPMIRRADRPTLGDGSPQTGQLAPPVSPR